MDERLSGETWRRLREDARRAAAEAARQEAERQTRAAMQTADLASLAQLEQELGTLNAAWAVHEKPLVTRIPLIGPLLAWLGSRLARFLLQHQVAFNAESARILQRLYQAQRLLTKDQIERTDEMFSRLDERILSLEARLRDLEEEVRRLRQER